jgi:hypothetical protein
MSISINCKLSLSKKLRALLGKEASLTLVSQDIVEGKGTAILILNSDDIKADIKPEEMGETSIMLIPVEISEESPNSNSPVHASIFSTIPQKYQEETLVQKMAAVHAPEKGQEARAIKSEAEVPEAFSELKNKDCSSWIKNMDELANAINVAKSKRSGVDPDYAQNAREKAILQELKEKSEAIDIPAWIINDKVGILSINDLNIALPLNSPYDLSNISAKRIAASKDLRVLLKEGYIRFISPAERDEFILKTVDGETESTSGLSIFDNHEQAMDNIGGSVVSSRNPIINDESAMDITEGDIVHKTEDESMILNLTQNMPTIKNRQPIPEGNRKTVHTNVTPTSTSKNPNVKPIRKLS